MGERNAFFARMEAGDPASLELWRRFRDISIERYAAVYARLNIHFDVYSGESLVRPQSMARAEAALRGSGVLESDGAARFVDFARHGSPALGIATLRDRAGVTTYLLRDLGGVLERAEVYDFDEMIYVVGNEQTAHFDCLFSTVALISGGEGNDTKPLLTGRQLRHVGFGRIENMSSRMASATVLSDILDQCGEASHEVMRTNADKYALVADPDAVADVIGISGVMVQDMTGQRANNYQFDMARMAAFRGDTGPYLQYCHARLCSMLRKANLSPDERAQMLKADSSNRGAKGEEEGEEGPLAGLGFLLRVVILYPEVTRNAWRNLEPSTVLTYLFRLSHQLSSNYEAVQVVDCPEGRNFTLARVAVYEAALQVLQNGMRLLDLTPVERLVFPPLDSSGVSHSTTHISLFHYLFHFVSSNYMPFSGLTS